jgi:hypothetical protein
MALRKKKGSALMFVLIAFTLIAIVAGSALTMTAADIKMRRQESQKTKELYCAESGLDIAYGVMTKTIDEDINKARQDTENYEKTYVQEYNSHSGEEGFVPLTAETLNGVLNTYFQGKFKSYIDGDLQDKIKNFIGYKSGVEIATSNFINNIGNNIKIKILSSFIADGETKKSVSVSYNIKYPTYERQLKSVDRDSEVPFYQILSKQLVTDDVLSITGKTSLAGDIWAKGSSTDPTSLTDKYGRGIDINGNIDFLGQVATAETLNIKASNTVNLSDKYETYAKNIKLGSSAGDSGITLNGSNISIYNDLVMNSINTNVLFNEYYGLNDMNDLSKDKMSLDNTLRTASSMIINSSDIGNGSSISIKNKLYIMGAAYLHLTNRQYKTGESIAINGNYKVYTQAVKDLDPKFEYIDPLQLVVSTKNTAQGSEMTVAEKAKYFDRAKDGSIRVAGLTLPSDENIVTAGTFLTKAYDNKYSIDTNNQLENKKKTYFGNVYNMGQESNIDSLAFTKFKDLNYKDTQIPIRKVSTEIDFSKLTSGVKNYDDVCFVLNNSNSTISIGSGSDSSKVAITMSGSSTECDRNKSIIIISNGNLDISCSGALKLVALCDGKIDVTSKSNLNIKKIGTEGALGSSNIDEIYKKYYEDIFKNIITGNAITSGTKRATVKESVGIDKYISAQDLVSKELWKLENY